MRKISSSHKKHIQEQEKYMEEKKQSSHFVIQINNHIFIDLGGIECLTNITNPQLVQALTLNFGSVTNEILKLSPYYEGHDF